MTFSASTSSRIFIEPISAVIALPERPAIMIAVISTPISRSYQDADKIDDEDFGAEIAELESALLGDDRADQERHQHDDRNGADAHPVDLVEDRGRGDAVPRPSFIWPPRIVAPRMYIAAMKSRGRIDARGRSSPARE